jgi:bacterioferritin
MHATQAGEHITALGGEPSLGIGELVGTHHREIDAMMQEMLVHEQKGVDLYRQLLEIVSGRSIGLEEYARTMIRDEELHISEIRKMLRH